MKELKVSKEINEKIMLEEIDDILQMIGDFKQEIDIDKEEILELKLKIKGICG